MKSIRLVGLWALTLPSLPLLAQSGYYLPKALMIPLHDRKNQIFASLGVGRGIDANFSYSVGPHVALFATGNVNPFRSYSLTLFGDKRITEHNDRSVTSGAGYFRTFPARRFNILEVYGGGGLFRSANYGAFAGETQSMDFTKAAYSQFFGQVSLGNKRQRYDFSIGLRLSLSHYNRMNFYTLDKSDYRYGFAPVEQHHSNNFVIPNCESVVSYSRRTKFVVINLQTGISVQPGNASAAQTTVLTTASGEIQHRSDAYFARLPSLLCRVAIQFAN